MDMGAVEGIVGEVRGRLGRNVVFQSMCKSLFWCTVAFAVALPLHRLLSPPFTIAWIAAGLFVAALVVGAGLAKRRYPSRLRAAVLADQAFALDDPEHTKTVVEVEPWD